VLNRPFSKLGGDISHRMGLWKTRRPIENERFSRQGTNLGARCLILHRRPFDTEIAESPAGRVDSHGAVDAAVRCRLIRPVGELGRDRLDRLVGSSGRSAASAFSCRHGNPGRSVCIARVHLQRGTHDRLPGHDRLPVGKRAFPGIGRSPNSTRNCANLRMVGAHRNSAFPFVPSSGRRCPGVGDRHNAAPVFPVVGTRKRRPTAGRSLRDLAASLRIRRCSRGPSGGRGILDGSSATGGRAAMPQCSQPHPFVLDR
jgi:hypothetical protein